MLVTDETGTDVTDVKNIYRTARSGDFPAKLSIELEREWELKYGENPHQAAAIYRVKSIAGRNASILAELTDLVSVRNDRRGKGGLSATNTMDISRAMQVLTFFDNSVACAIMKHNIVSGFSRRIEGLLPLTQANVFRSARDCDRRSNFGGTAVFTTSLDMETAEAMFEAKPFFVDVVAAPDYEEGVVGFLEGQSANMRIAGFSNLNKLPKFEGDDTYGLLSVKEMPGGRFVVQDYYLTGIRSSEDLGILPYVRFTDGSEGKERIKRAPEPMSFEFDDMLTAWYLNIHGARSNGVVFVRRGELVSMGSGQVERVGAIEQALVKGVQKAMDREGISYNPLYGIAGYERLKHGPFQGASCASDGFFPFADSIELMGTMGVSAVLQPFGSNRDREVIAEANKYNIAMCATGERGFGHF